MVSRQCGNDHCNESISAKNFLKVPLSFSPTVMSLEDSVKEGEMMSQFGSEAAKNRKDRFFRRT